MSRFLFLCYVILSGILFLAVFVFFFWQLITLRTHNEAAAHKNAEELLQYISELQEPYEKNIIAAYIQSMNTPIPTFITVYDYNMEINYLWTVTPHILTRPLRQRIQNVPPAAIMDNPSQSLVTTNDLIHITITQILLADEERQFMTIVFPAFDMTKLFFIFRDTFIALLGFIIFMFIGTGLFYFTGITRNNAPVTVPKEGRIPYKTRNTKRTPAAYTDMAHNSELSAASAEHAESTELQEADDEAVYAHEQAIHTTEKSMEELQPEESLMPQLTAELHRAAFHGQDISIAMIQFVKVKEHLRNIKMINTFFAFQDMCFAYGRNAAVLLFPSTTLLETMSIISHFQQSYHTSLRAWNEPKAQFYCGISSRNTRIIDASLILRECTSALKRARKSTRHIIAFDADTQKYRQHITEK